jgi:cytochrome c oxidase subunit II
MPIIPQASSAAGRVDSVFLFIFVLCVAFLALITAALIYFVIKYNRKRNPRAEDIEGNAWIETIWTVGPAAIFLVMFFYGWTDFRYMREVPREAMVIEATGRQWAWSFKYPNGKRTSELLLAVDKPVKIELRSLDVLHGFFIPAFRIKEDVVPGKENYTWFVPTQLGSFDIECTVICGVSHAMMLSKAVVVPVSDFESWYFGDEDALPPKQLKASRPAKTDAKTETEASPALNIMNQKFCPTCHSVDGSALVGPSFKGLYGRKQVVVDSKGKEREMAVDDAYLARAIQDPGFETVKGYPPAMPKSPLTDAELKQVIEFIKTLK